jgi:putative transposase
MGDIPLTIPKLRSGSFFPSILEPRRRIDQALYAVIMEAWVKGISTRKVDALVAAIGLQAGISRSEVSRICQGLDEQIQAFLERPLEGTRYPLPGCDVSPRPARQDPAGLLPCRRRGHGGQQ